MLMLIGALGQQPAAPVEIERCSTGTETSGMLLKTNGNYAISFVDRDTRTIDDVHFIVHIGAQRIYINDAGKFEPGVVIEHRFPNRGGEIVLVDSPAISCEVREVHFTDSSDWRAPFDTSG